MKRKPNFIFFVADQMRHDLVGCSGNRAISTPHIDGLAREGVRFERCYANQPMCMAVRATWLTGRTPRSHGVRCNGIPLDRAIPTITGALREGGYRTHSIGKLHLTPWFPPAGIPVERLDPERWPEAMPLWDAGRIDRLPSPYYGFESADFLCGKYSGHYRSWLLEREPRAFEILRPPPEFESVEKTPDVSWRSRLPAELHHSSWAADCAARFLREEAGPDRPFFLWVSVPDPHPPYAVADPWYSIYPGDCHRPARRPGELDQLPPHYRHLYEQGLKTAGRIAPTRVSPEREAGIFRTVYAMVSQWDAMVGKVLAELEKSGRAGNTVVAVMSDHGQMLGDHWMHNMPPSHLDGTLRVPSIWRCPGRFPAGRALPDLAGHLDFAPTVLDLAGLPVPEGETPPSPEALAQRPPWPGRSLARLLEGTGGPVNDSVIAENDEDYLGMRQRTIITQSYHLTCYIGEPYGELFDLREDPGQLHNRWDDPSMRRTRDSLIGEMMYRFAETDSVLPRRLSHA